MTIESLSAVTLATTDMRRSVRFYEELGFELTHGDGDATFSTFTLGRGYLNLQLRSKVEPSWGRVILHVTDVDAMYRRSLELGLEPEAPPRDAEWGERFFHLADPDGHGLSFARPLPPGGE